MATKESFTYTSSIDNSITGLFANIYYPSVSIIKPLPMVLFIHGFYTDANSFTDAFLEDFSDSGAVVLSLGMRGKNGATGNPESNGLETVDVLDGIVEAIKLYPNIINPNRIYPVGFSEGGGTVMALATRYPDYFPAYVNHFGISDYGSLADGWIFTNPAFATDLTARIGTPATNPENYFARNFRKGVSKNMTGGHMYIFHDTGDTAVDVIHSQQLVTALTAEGQTNFTYTEDPAYVHGVDTSGSEDIWKEDILNNVYKTWTIPESGTMFIAGHLYTKRFNVWLNNGNDASADLTYDVNTGVFVVTPESATPITVTFNVNGKTETRIINGQETFNFDPIIKLIAPFGNDDDISQHTGEVGEINYNADKKTLTVHDGNKVGGFDLALTNKIICLELANTTTEISDLLHEYEIQLEQDTNARTIQLTDITEDAYKVTLVSKGTGTITVDIDSGNLIGTNTFSGVGSIMEIRKLIDTSDYIIKIS